MAFLLDTNVISEMRRPRPSAEVVRWYAGLTPTQVFLSVISIGEIQRGILKVRQQAAGKADELTEWLHGLETAYQDALLPVDVSVSKAWAGLRSIRPGGDVEDLLIAATALAHGLTVATRNVRDFADLGVPLHNPFEPAGGGTP